MNEAPVPEEPLNNVELESAILGLRMALTPEEESEAREKFLNLLAVATLAVPTVNPVQTNPDGSIAPNAEITFLVVETTEGVSGVPAFTSLNFMRAALPNVQNAVFLPGARIASGIVASPHLLFVDGPDMHAVVEKPELEAMSNWEQQTMQEQQAAMEHNKNLEEALANLTAEDSDSNREAVKMAFLMGFSRIPVARDLDDNPKCIVMRTGDPNDEAAQQQIPLITENDELLVFSGQDALLKWKDLERNSVTLPGPMICDMVVRTGIGKIRINSGSPDSRTALIQPPDKFLIQ